MPVFLLGAASGAFVCEDGFRPTIGFFCVTPRMSFV